MPSMNSASFVPSLASPLRPVSALMPDFSKPMCADGARSVHSQIKRPLAVWSAASGLKNWFKDEHYSAPVPPNLAAPHSAVESKTGFHNQGGVGPHSPSVIFALVIGLAPAFTAPMMDLAIRIKHALNAPVEGAHDADPREHGRAARGARPGSGPPSRPSAAAIRRVRSWPSWAPEQRRPADYPAWWW